MWPSHGLAILDQLGLDRYRYYHSTRADLLRRNGRDTEARQAYQRALELTQTEPERRYLQGRLAELTPSDSPHDRHLDAPFPRPTHMRLTRSAKQLNAGLSAHTDHLPLVACRALGGRK
jgi:RNA polymerase sigma-70 factor (ECF subfamily)